MGNTHTQFHLKNYIDFLAVCDAHKTEQNRTMTCNKFFNALAHKYTVVLRSNTKILIRNYSVLFCLDVVFVLFRFVLFRCLFMDRRYVFHLFGMASLSLTYFSNINSNSLASIDLWFDGFFEIVFPVCLFGLVIDLFIF